MFSYFNELPWSLKKIVLDFKPNPFMQEIKLFQYLLPLVENIKKCSSLLLRVNNSKNKQYFLMDKNIMISMKGAHDKILEIGIYHFQEYTKIFKKYEDNINIPNTENIKVNWNFYNGVWGCRLNYNITVYLLIQYDNCYY